jgi:NitT/TauT family transport system ATP-binding protein
MGDSELMLQTATRAAVKLRIEDVALRFTPRRGAPVTALERISLDVRDKEFSVIVGPSGCGKTSLLRLVAGLIEPTEGAIWLDEQRITGPGRDRGMVFQSYTLFPWLTVQQNVEFGLKVAGTPPVQRRESAPTSRGASSPRSDWKALSGIIRSSFPAA